MVLQNSDDQGFSVNSDGWSLSAGVTARTLTLSGADFPLLLSSVTSGNILQYNGTNWINVNGTTFGTGSVTNIATGTGLTGGPITNTGTISVSLNGISSALFRQSAANTLVGNPTGSTANVTDVVLGTTLFFNTGQLQTAAITGDVTSGTNSFATTLATVNSNVGTFNGFTVNGKGLVTAAANIVASGDASGTVSGTSLPLTLATVNSNVGTFGSGTSFPSIVVNGKGLITSVTTVALGSIASQNASNVNITGGTITGLPTPVNASDAATKSYVDNVTAGLTAKAEINWATTGTNLAATYANGTSGVGATLTITATGPLVIDGGTTALNDRILVKDQTSQLQNGIYSVTTVGTTGTSAVLTRTTDFNSSSTVFDGAYVVVGQGTVNKGTLWILTNTGDTTYTIGTTAINFTELTVANQSLTFTGDVTGAGAGTIALTLATVNSNVGTFSALTVNGKGLVTAATNLVASGDVTGTASNAGIALTLGSVNANPGTFAVTTANTKGLVTSAANLVVSGDVTGTSSGTALALTLGTSGVTAGTYGSATAPAIVTVNAKGLVTAISTGTTTLGTGSVTNIATGTGLTGGPITNTGTISIATNGVSNALFRQSVASSLVGNSGTATGNVADIGIGATLAFVGGTLETVALTGDVTTSANSFSTTIAANAVTNSKFRQSAALSVVGNATNATANVADITATASSNAVLMVAPSGTALTWNTIQTANIANSAITYAKIQNETASTLLGNPNGTAQAPQEITLGTGLVFTGTTLAIGTTGVTAGTYSTVVVNAQGQVTAGTSQDFNWVTISGTAQTASTNTGYIPNNSALCTITLPSTANVGDIVRVGGKGSGGWKVAQNANQIIHFSTKNTTTGTAGSIASNNQYNCIELLCITANTDFVVLSSVGNLTIS